MTMTILMVDDEPDAEALFRQKFRREMRRAEYDFHFAQSGQAALDLLQQHQDPPVLLLLSDINMPGMNGMELLEHVKQDRPHLPVIMITAYGDEGTEAEAKSRGAELLVSKPVDFDSLKTTIESFAEAAQ